jgi:hypothetical protein
MKVFLTLSPKSFHARADIQEYLSKRPEVPYLVEGIGIPGDLDFEILVSSQAEFFESMEKLRRAFPSCVERYEFFYFDKLLKVNYFPFS